MNPKRILYPGYEAEREKEERVYRMLVLFFKVILLKSNTLVWLAFHTHMPPSPVAVRGD
jgi:hypothetical protein